MQANCRYGPGKAYLYAHGLYEGDTALAHGRTASGSWLWVQPEGLERHCWVAASVVALDGEAASLPVVQTRLPQSTFYSPPQNVQADRDGDQVWISWERVAMTADDDRGYLLEAMLCQDGRLMFVAIQTADNQYEFRDEPGCPQASTVYLYTVDKHGYSTPVTVPLP